MIQLLITFIKSVLWFIFYGSTNNKTKQIIPLRKSNKTHKYTIITQDILYDKALQLPGTTIITRQHQKSCHDLDLHNKNGVPNKISLKLKKNERFICYGCGKPHRSTHPVYVFSCMKCGSLNQKYRYFNRDLTGQIALVTGCRTKLGHQITLKLLRANCKVIGTTRYPDQAIKMYEQYEDYSRFKDNLIIYHESIDFDNDNIVHLVVNLVNFIQGNFMRLNILINCAAQTIRVREKNKPSMPHSLEENRYGDAKFVSESDINSWQITISDVDQDEMQEVYRVNAIAPCILVQSLLPLLKKSIVPPYVINVHAREGLFNVHKSGYHLHLNMAKSALHMLTKCLIRSNLKTESENNFCIHGCDPGWISVDEYYKTSRPWIVPPLDEIDGAARILYPLFAKLRSCSKTRRHFKSIKS